MRVKPRASCIPKAEDVERHSNAARVLLTVYSTLTLSYTIDQNRLVITIRYHVPDRPIPVWAAALLDTVRTASRSCIART